jgi:hypothetical protein
MGSRGLKRHRPSFKITSATARQGRPAAVALGPTREGRKSLSGLCAWTSASLAVDNRRGRCPDADVTSGRPHKPARSHPARTFRPMHAYVNQSVCTPPREPHIRRPGGLASWFRPAIRCSESVSVGCAGNGSAFHTRQGSPQPACCRLDGDDRRARSTPASCEFVSTSFGLKSGQPAVVAHIDALNDAGPSQ